MAYITFIKKEIMELARTGKLTVLCILFVLFGIMNPAIAKLTPELMKLAKDSLSESGMILGEVTVTDMSSWQQFIKNAPVVLIIFLVMFAATVTNEYAKGTIIPVITRGVSPATVIAAKLSAVALTWTCGYAIMFGITYAYNEYFWGNSKANNIFFTSVLVYVLGLFLMSLMFVISNFVESNTSVIALTAVMFFVMYMLGIVPVVSDYMPTKLLSLYDLLDGKSCCGDYMKAFGVTVAGTVVCIITSIKTARK